MKIYIHDPKAEKDIHLKIPNSLVMNPLALIVIRKAISRNAENLTISEKQMKVLVKELKKSIRRFGHFELVSVESSDGEIVKITF